MFSEKCCFHSFAGLENTFLASGTSRKEGSLRNFLGIRLVLGTMRSFLTFETENFILRHSRYSSGIQQPHSHQHSSISFVMRGRVEETVAGKVGRGRSLNSVVKPAGTLHADRYGSSGASLLQIELKSEDLLNRGRSWRWHHAGSPVRHFLFLAHLLHAKDSTEENLDHAAHCVLANLSPHLSRQPAPHWLKKARAAILETSIRDLVRVQDLAGKIGVHPVYLTRRFHRHFGETIRSLIRRRRVQAAANYIADTQRPLVEIACNLGYTDQAHFCREFLKTTGIRPSDFRRMIHANP
jgi:AraC family transcriptional regulator